MSTNRTPVKLVAVNPVAGPESLDFLDELCLLGLEPLEFGLPIPERAQIA